MVADLAQLHGHVLQALRVDVFLGYHLLIVEPLPRRHVAEHDKVRLFGQPRLHLGLLAAQQERTEHVVQPVDDQRALLLRQQLLALRAAL